MHCTDWEQAVGLQGPESCHVPIKPCWQVQGLRADCAEEDAGPICQALTLRRQAKMVILEDFPSQLLSLKQAGHYMSS